MRVITGTAKGIMLETQKGKELVRPTTGRVKEAMFSAIQFEIANATVLDLFAGSGQLGVEALSRGAATCTFVDSRIENKAIISYNLKKTKLESKSIIQIQDAILYLQQTSQTFDLIFLDPPYDKQLLPKILQYASDCLHAKGKIICEMQFQETILYPDELVEASNKKYGKTKVIILVKRENHG